MQWLLSTMCLIHVSGKIFCLLKQNKNPEAHMNVSEIIEHWGYPSEEYKVVTDDGYILPINHIPHGKNNADSSAPKMVVFCQHGLFSTAGVWVSNPPNNSLAFILADAGYDVWLGNSRGSTWAKEHVTLNADSKEFWAFSFDQMITYDLPATINFILEKTGQKQIYYIGHSQGTLIAIGAFATNQELVAKIKFNIFLGPVYSVQNTRGFGNLGSYLFPTTIKAKRNAVLRAYDWGPPSLNMQHYSQTTPPVYNVEDMKVPTAMFSGLKDFLSNPEDVEILKAKIPNLVYHKTISDFSHFDFILGLNARKEVSEEVLAMLRKYDVDSQL
ncbi:tear acid lipase-like protein [Grammomys surdaster]|uniref:tear acid lipase-like protein n=1 Tax=Grammomys surdaster TaxID=491861 RepID=UPI0010A08CED|nr:tear acid lipase-like protein [Grammomys surdaster]